MSQTILVTGNLSEGFNFIGPFEDFEEAAQYVIDNKVVDDNWIATLNSPTPSCIPIFSRRRGG